MTAKPEENYERTAAPWDPFSTAPPAMRRAVWVALAVVVATFQGSDFLAAVLPNDKLGVDFFQDWASAKNWFVGRPIYSPHSETLPAYLGVPEDVVIFINVNAHPPPSVLLVLPFGRLDLPAAVSLWSTLSLSCFVVAGVLLARELAIPFRLWAVFPTVALLLLWAPLRVELIQGQFNGVLTLLLTLIWFWSRRGSPRLSGCALGFAAAIKLYPGFLILYFAVRRRWTEALWGVASLIVLTTASASVLGAQAYVDYVQKVMPSVRGHQGSPGNLSVHGFWSKLLDPEEGRDLPTLVPIAHRPGLAKALGVAIALALTGLALATFAQFRRNPADRNDAQTPGAGGGCGPCPEDHAFGLAVVTMALVSPITWDHYLTTLAIPLAFLWLDMGRTPNARLLFLAFLCLALAPHYSSTVTRDQTLTATASLTVLSLQTYLLLALYFACRRFATPSAR